MDYINYQAQVQFRITFPAAHNPAEDWSFQGVPATSGATPVTVSDLTLYAGNTLIWGSPPLAGAPPGAPGALAASGITTTGATLSWAASTAGTNPIIAYDIYTSGGTFVAATPSTSYTLTSLNGNRTAPYGYYVAAVDSQGLASPGHHRLHRDVHEQQCLPAQLLRPGNGLLVTAGGDGAAPDQACVS